MECTLAKQLTFNRAYLTTQAPWKTNIQHCRPLQSSSGSHKAMAAMRTNTGECAGCG